jgi:DNA-binding NarL/FixJ family response regulator
MPKVQRQDLPGILIVDDHPLIRRTVRSLLEVHDLHICGEAGDGKAAIEKATDLRPDIIVLDIFMPLMNGFEAAQEIRRILPAIKIVFLTMHDSAAFEARTRLWSHGFVHKSDAGTQLVPVLKDLLIPAQQMKFSWQRYVTDAFAASRETSQEKINLAERAIAVRLRDKNQPNPEERIALNEALRALRELMSKKSLGEREDKDKYGVA